ncbi:MAG: ATP-binding cassette domain-containing protein [Firmicutes bacterium]|nr:ATP-binding cassette domain-containing protein [Bacillota bacterium]
MIELVDISKTFDNGIEKVEVLKPVSIKMNAGESIVIIGGNGAGKSTLLNIISGNLKPTTGQIKIDGVDVTKMPRHKRAAHVACVFQDPNSGVCPDMSIAENLAMALSRGKKRLLGRAIKRQHLEVFKEKLVTFNPELKDRLNQKVSLLSGGQRQVITLLMATLQKPQLLLLDEHISALDPKIAKQVMEITRSLINEQKITTIMITHNLKDAVAYADRLIMFSAGRITMDVSGDEKKKLTPAKLVTKFE